MPHWAFRLVRIRERDSSSMNDWVLCTRMQLGSPMAFDDLSLFVFGNKRTILYHVYE